MPSLLSSLAEILSDDPAFLLLTCHDARWPASRLCEAVGGVLADAEGVRGSTDAEGLRGSASRSMRPKHAHATRPQNNNNKKKSASSGRGHVECGVMMLRATLPGGHDLPMGAFARWQAPHL